ncbi:hypothetical protein ACHAWU_004571 [Discostella pseudostelligera]|uniref:Uncharacterized protein n=1 Tax=Discostella pseudostelligera TaxID=259834 RepID=A0ABD3MKW9_9STRA
MSSNSPKPMPPSLALAAGAAAAAAAAAAGGGEMTKPTTTTTTNNSVTATSTSVPYVSFSSTATTTTSTAAMDAYSALITPTKLVSDELLLAQQQQQQHGKKDKKRQLQLQLTTTKVAVNKGSAGETGSMALKRQHKMMKSNDNNEEVLDGVAPPGSVMPSSLINNNNGGSTSTNAASATTTATTTTTAAPPPPPPPSSSMMIKWPPVSSTKALPPLGTGLGLTTIGDDDDDDGNNNRAGGMLQQQQQQRNVIEFEVNQECTSIGLVPSGRLAIAGFTDGTLRLFDLTGHFAKDKYHPQMNNFGGSHSSPRRGKQKMTAEELFDDDASSTSSSSSSSSSSSVKSSTSSNNNNNNKNNNSNKSSSSSSNNALFLDSHINQRYGAVACQIHARGVHTSLLMDVAISEDGLYAFGGVQRGSVELVAVYLGDVENYLDERTSSLEEKDTGNKSSNGGGGTDNSPGLLDLIHVDRHADAKLKGFGACTRLWNGWERARNGVERPEYLLFTGKGIKNIHIWSYRPSRPADNEESVWSCLYDTQTNGTSITQLYFRHNAHGTLQGISKSDNGQKLRVWDLSYEQRRIANGTTDESDRPKRPEYVDVASTEGTIGVCGPYAFASGSLGGMHNIINVVGLDADDASSPFNCTELALPVDAAGDFSAGNRNSRTGRQQRGDLKSVVNVAGLVFDASHALLQLSDGSVVHYLHHQSGHPMLLQTPPSLCTTCVDDDVSSIGGFSAVAGLNQNKKMALARVGSQGMVLFAVSSFNENTSRGAIMLRTLPGSSVNDGNGSKSFWRYWGFNGLKRKRKQQTPSVNVTRPPVAASVIVNATPVPEARSQDSSALRSSRAPLQTIVEVDKSNRRKSPADVVVNYTPVPSIKCVTNNNAHSVRKVTPGDIVSTVEPVVDSIVNVDKPSRSNKKRRSEDYQMDIQLQSIVHGYNSEAAHTPKRSDGDSEKSSARVVVQRNHTESALVTIQPTSEQGKKQVAAPVIAKKQKTSEQGSKPVASPVAEKSLLANSPKTRGGKSKNEPSMQSNVPSLSANEPVVVQPAEQEPVTKMVGFLGVTILDRKVERELPESCFQPLQRPMLFVEKLPTCTVGSRLAKYKAVQHSTEFTTRADDVRFKLHCDERQKLAARHRAEHEMIRRKVLHSIRYVMATWDIELNSNKSHASIVESAKKWFDKALESHEEVLNDMLCRQEMEAEALAARQTSELDNERAPVLHVSFPFPQVFDMARQEMITMFR